MPNGTVPSSNSRSILTPIRSSLTLANINQVLEHGQYLFDDFHSDRWQSDGENLNIDCDGSKTGSSSMATYLVNDFLFVSIVDSMMFPSESFF